MILEAIDRFYGMSQLTGKVYGFIDAGDASITDVQSVERHLARFSSPDAGWPEFEIELPADARFDYALSGPLTRAAGWTSDGSRSEIRAFMEQRLQLPGGTWRPWQTGDSYHASVGGADITIRVYESKRGTRISVRQQRTREGLRVSMRTRLAARNRSGAPK